MIEKMNQILYDLHIHSHFSFDCKSDPKEIIKVAKKKNLAGIAITDHNSVKFHLKKYNSKGLLIIPGIEVSTEKGHVIGLGIRELIEKKLSVIETVEKIIDLGGLPVIPHPFDFTRRGIGKEIHKLKEVAIETLNASCPLQLFNKKAKKWAERNNLPETGGSDSHRIQDIGMAFTIFKDELETIDEVLEAISRQRSSSGGTHLSIPEKIVRFFQIHF